MWKVILSSDAYPTEVFEYRTMSEAVATLERLTKEAQKHEFKDHIGRAVVMSLELPKFKPTKRRTHEQ